MSSYAASFLPYMRNAPKSAGGVDEGSGESSRQERGVSTSSSFSRSTMPQLHSESRELTIASVSTPLYDVRVVSNIRVIY